MPTQSDFNRVNQYIIQPVRKLFGGEINDYAIEAMIEDLCGYSDEVLQEGMKLLRKTAKRHPSIAHIVEACEDAAKVKTHTGTGFVYAATKPVDHVAQAEAVMKTQFGQMALREGWANDVWVTTVRSGKTDYTDVDADRFRASLARAVKDAAMLEKGREVMEPEKRKLLGILMDTAMANALWNLWLAFQQKEEGLRIKYLKLLPAPPASNYRAYAD